MSGDVFDVFTGIDVLIFKCDLTLPPGLASKNLRVAILGWVP